MIILGIDTSTSFASVGLSVEGNVSTEIWESRHNHGREVMPAVMRLLDDASLKPSDLDAVTVALGPGGFSSVRVGIATAQGLVAPTKAKLIGIPTHRIQAYMHRNALGKQIVSVIPVGRKQVSFAIYATPLSGLDGEPETGIIDTDQIGIKFGDDDVLCGEIIADLAHSSPRPPEHLIAIAAERIQDGVVTNCPIEPIYSRPPTITAPRKM